MSARSGLAAALAAAILGAGIAAGAPPADPALGERIYREGVLPSGEPLAATTLGDIAVAGAAAACATCHRPSGQGSREGAAYVPPVTAAELFADRDPRRADLFRGLYQDLESGAAYSRARDPRLRPAYDDAALIEVLRSGRDPSGRRLDPMMPRYALADGDAAHLVAYLRTLGAAADPGVDAETIHLATVVAAAADPGRRAAVADVLGAYLRWKNADTAGLLARPAGSPWHRDSLAIGYRRWVLHTWVVDGPPEGWAGQLERAYRERPVFALVSGLGAGEWRPVHEFCERQRVPCLFPNAEPPPGTPPGGYALYFDRGIEAEAGALARVVAGAGRVAERNGAGPGAAGRSGEDALGAMSIVQVYRDAGTGRAAAAALRRALDSAQDPATGPDLVDRPVAAGETLAPAAWRRLPNGAESSLVVLWLDAADLAALGSPPASLDAALAGLVVSARLGGAAPPFPERLTGRTLLTWPWALPGHAPAGAYRARSWLRSRGVAGDHERLRLQTWFALSVLDAALHHLVDRFSRDYLVEAVEHETEGTTDPGVYPRLSLGPGQRFASKGCYLVRPPGAGRGVEPVTGWIVP